MKNAIRIWGIIALVAVIGFTFVGCDNGSGGGVLAAPSGLNATPVSSTDIRLSWNAVAGAAGYNVYVSYSSSSGFLLADTTTVTAMNFYNATPNTTYYFKVAAYSANGTEGAMSGVASTTTPPGGSGSGGVPAAPTGLSATANSFTLTVTWNAVSGANGYNLYVSFDNFTTSVSDKVYGTTYTETVTTPGTYYFRVSAFNASGEGAMSNIVTATVSGTPSYSLNGVWQSESGNNEITVTGSTGIWSKFYTTDPLQLSAENKGYWGLGKQYWRNITSTGTSTWSGQIAAVSFYNSNPTVATGIAWRDCTFTLSNNGQTLTVNATYGNNNTPFTATWTRK